MLSAPSLSLPLSSVNQTQNPFTGISISLFKEVQKQLPRKDHSVNEFIVKSDKLENFIKLNQISDPPVGFSSL